MEAVARERPASAGHPIGPRPPLLAGSLVDATSASILLILLFAQSHHWLALWPPLATVKERAQVNGTLQQVLYKEGQMVKKGDVLAVIDPRQFEMAVQQALGQRMKDEAQLQAAIRYVERHPEKEGLARQHWAFTAASSHVSSDCQVAEYSA